MADKVREVTHSRPGSLAEGLLLIAGFGACAFYFLVEMYLLGGDLGFPLDDSWIHLQFARNLASGEGLSYDGGILVTGSTAPLWTAVLSAAFFLWGDPIWWSKLFGVGCYLGVVHASSVLARELGLTRNLALLAGGLTLSSSWLVWSALSGMEILLFTLLTLWGMILHTREARHPDCKNLSFAVLGLSILARPEGALLLVLATLDRFIISRSRDEGRLLTIKAFTNTTVRGLLAALSVVGPVLIFYWIVGGSILPTTFAVKATGTRHWWPQVSYLSVVLGIFFMTQPVMTLTASGGVVSLLRKLGTSKVRGLLPCLWLIGLPVAYSLISPGGARVLVGNAGRYYFPLIPVVIVLGTLGIESVFSDLARVGLRARRRILAVSTLALILLPSVVNFSQGALRYAHNVADVQESDVRIARWLAERLPPEALIAVNDIGALKYLLPNPVIDLAGIVDPEIQQAIQEAAERRVSWQREMRRIIGERKPDYLVIFPDWFPGLLDKESGFVPIHMLENPDNRTMGGNRIVVFSTPWTRYRLKGI